MKIWMFLILIALKPIELWANEENNQSPVTPEFSIDRDAERENTWHFVLGIGYMMNAPEASFDDATYTANGQTAKGNAKFEYSKVASISFEGKKSAKYEWGGLFGLNYEAERTFERGSMTAGSETASLVGGSGASKVSFATFYGSAAYRWENFYLPFGLNYSAVKFTPAAGATGSITAMGGLGAQLGVGWRLNSPVSFEFYSWVTAMKLTISDGSTTADFGVGYFPSIRAFLKYEFY